MEDEILDSNLYLEGFIPPRVFLVEGEPWIKLCNTLEKKSYRLIALFFPIAAFSVLLSSVIYFQESLLLLP